MVVRPPKDPTTLDARTAFGEAMSFLLASRAVLIHMGHTDDLRLYVPAVVLEAYAAEAFLKCLLIMRHVPVQQTHELSKLFTDLPDADRQALSSGFSRVRHEDPLSIAMAKTVGAEKLPATLEDLLAKSSSAFVDFRYLYERTASLGGAGFSVVLQVLKRRILAEHPSWQDADPMEDRWGSITKLIPRPDGTFDTKPVHPRRTK